jgi:hypothetical protein
VNAPATAQMHHAQMHFCSRPTWSGTPQAGQAPHCLCSGPQAPLQTAPCLPALARLHLVEAGVCVWRLYCYNCLIASNAANNAGMAVCCLCSCTQGSGGAVFLLTSAGPHATPGCQPDPGGGVASALLSQSSLDNSMKPLLPMWNRFPVAPAPRVMSRLSCARQLLCVSCWMSNCRLPPAACRREA